MLLYVLGEPQYTLNNGGCREVTPTMNIVIVGVILTLKNYWLFICSSNVTGPFLLLFANSGNLNIRGCPGEEDRETTGL